MSAALFLESLREALEYDPDTGCLRWKPRGAAHFDNKYAGKIAGTLRVRAKQLTYLCVGFRGRNYYAHRLAWLIHFGEMPKEIDHINGDGLDNRIANLRSVYRTANMRNRRIATKREGRCAGVYAVGKRWKAYIGAKPKKYLGSFATEAEAVAARKAVSAVLGYSARHGLDGAATAP